MKFNDNPPLDSKFNKPDHSPGFLLWQVSNLWQRQQRAALAPLGLTHVQFILLAGVVWLEKSKGPITQSELATHAGTDPMMTSQVIRNLQSRGFIRRIPHPRDKRKMQLSATPEGIALAQKSIQIVESVDANIFQNLGGSQQIFTQLLKKIVGH